MSLADKVIVISGSGGLLGEALATRFAAERPAALMLGDVNAAGLDRSRAAAAAVADGMMVDGMLADVRDPQQVDALVDAAVERHGRIDVLVNNAGVLSPNGRIHNVDASAWQAALDVNLMGAVHGIRSAVRAMRPRGSGAIVNTASVAGLTAWSHAAPYCVSKAAVIHLTKVAALEYARDGILVNCVCPGAFPSAMHEDLPPEAMEALGSRHPLGLGSADRIVGAYVYLASDDASWTTGEALVVDGGYAVP